MKNTSVCPPNPRKTAMGESGRIVHEPADQPHSCQPPIVVRGGPGALPAPPNPPGTVWECSCGRTWVVGKVKSKWVDKNEWRSEPRFARWRRERRTRQRRADSGVVVLDPVTAPADVLPPSAAIVTKGGTKPPNSPTPPRGSHKTPPPPPRGRQQPHRPPPHTTSQLDDE